MKNLSTILAALLVLAAMTTASAQVKFKISFDEASQRYTVSAVPLTTYLKPENITGTGQVTIKVPSNQFDPVDITNHARGMFWEANSRNNTPIEAPGMDYISFGLIIQGIAYPDYVQFTDIPLFSFRNALGCTGKIYLVDNQVDPFFPPNSLNSNIGNTLTIMGARGDAYVGISGPNVCDCKSSVTGTTEELKLLSYKIYPNPAIEVVNAEINWQGDAKDAIIHVVDTHGRKINSRPVSLFNGQNQFKFDITALPPANYWIQVLGENMNISIGKFAKQQ